MPFVCSVGWVFVRSIVRSAFRSLVLWFVHYLVPPLVCFVRSLVSLVLRSFIRSTGRSFSRAFARSFGRLFVVLKLLYFVTDNPPTLPGIDDNKVYVSTTNYQYHDDAEEFLSSEVLSNYGDLLVSFKGPSMYWSDMRVSLLVNTRSARVCHGMTEVIKS